MSASCEHLERNPEGVEWSDNDALGHFLTCLTETQKVEYWVHLRRFADTGRMCEMQDHRGMSESQRQYTLSMLTKLRDLQAYLEDEVRQPNPDWSGAYGDVLVRLKGILS